MWSGGARRRQHRHGMLLYQALCYSWNLLFLIHGRVKEIWILWMTRGFDIALFHFGRDAGLRRWVFCDSTGLNSTIFPTSSQLQSLSLNLVHVISRHLSWRTASDSSLAPVSLLGIQFGLWDMVIIDLFCKLCNPEALALKHSLFHAAGSLENTPVVCCLVLIRCQQLGLIFTTLILGI